MSKIETKFNIDQDVYYLEDNRIVKGTIDGIKIDIDRRDFITSEMSIKYRVKAGNSYSYFAEESIFSDTEELCAYLIQSAKL